MTDLRKFLVGETHAPAAGPGRLPPRSIGARVLLVAALLAPLAVITPPTAQGQVPSPGPFGGLPGAPQSSAGWTALPNGGLNGNVSAMAVCGGNLYVGGLFQQTADNVVLNLNNIAELNLTSNTWSALPHLGLNNEVFALACLGTDLYVGGTFTNAMNGPVPGLNLIARFDTVGQTWSALPHAGLGGIPGFNQVKALAPMGSDLYLGGFFSKTGDGVVTDLNYIAKFSTTGQAWSALPHKGLNNEVSALAVSGSDLYVGGTFANAFDAGVLNLHAIARLGGGLWNSLPNNGLDFEVDALAFNGSDLYVGGAFTQSADHAVTNIHNLVELTSGHWVPVADHGLNGPVGNLMFSGGDLYVGGLGFTQTSDNAVKNLNNVARLSTVSNAWSALPNQGLNNQVHSLLLDGGNLYVGGLFTETITSQVAGPAAPNQMLLGGIGVLAVATACGTSTTSVTAQAIACADGGGLLTVAATAEQFLDGDVQVLVTDAATCGAQPIAAVRVLTPDGINPLLSGPVGAPAGVFVGSVPLFGTAGTLDTQTYCDGSSTPVRITILTVLPVVIPDSGGVGFGSLVANFPNANPHVARVELHYLDPNQGDVVWNANPYNQFNPQTTTSGASGKFGWSVPSGTYYVRVSGPCFQTTQSPTVTVPPALTNLNLTLQPVAGCSNLYLPLAGR